MAGGYESDCEMLIIDGKIADPRYKLKAIYPYKEGGTFSCSTLHLDMSSRPSEEQVLSEVAKTGLYNGLGMGLILFETDYGNGTGTTFSLTPPAVGRKGLSLSTEHNINLGRQHQMTITKSNADPDLIEQDEWVPVRVLLQGTDEEFMGIESNYATPRPSPGKGEQLVMKLAKGTGSTSDGEEGSETEGEGADEDADEEESFRTPVGRGARPRERRRKARPQAVKGKEEDNAGSGHQAAEAKAEAEAEDLAQAAARQLWREEREAAQKARQEEKEVAEKCVVLTAKPSGAGVVRIRNHPDAAFVEHTWTQELLQKGPAWFVPDPEDPTCAQWDEEQGWVGGDNIAGHGNPGQTTDEGYFRDVYGLPFEAARGYAHAAKKVYRPHVKGLSPGKVIAQNATTMMVTCSFVRGGSGSVLSRVETPLAVVAMHVRQKLTGRGQLICPSNVALKMSAPWIVLGYAKHVVPRLNKQLETSSWPKDHEEYMKQALVRYLVKHQPLIEAHGLWDACYRLLETHLVDVDE
ncbi:hypothetical protein KFL_006880020 [Klebsormidium nitens]|uniref:Uncharacterized protein n=1 Tax=Klebsormidium nitens TaxID=105231 RepID=A0A1Y1IIV9_KLENI|nr:hypothetical protein KFL_006880020 [Klebsormidium nitens]|eukprot:GAQ90810.1 hypothetical protein KFL_006880020 [Klebsormidium nitens]